MRTPPRRPVLAPRPASAAALSALAALALSGASGCTGAITGSPSKDSLTHDSGQDPGTPPPHTGLAPGVPPLHSAGPHTGALPGTPPGGTAGTGGTGAP